MTLQNKNIQTQVVGCSLGELKHIGIDYSVLHYLYRHIKTTKHKDRNDYITVAYKTIQVD